MPHKPDREGYYPGSRHYNARCQGDIHFNRLTLRDMRDLLAEVIVSVWVVEERRELTRKEIAKLYAASK